MSKAVSKLPFTTTMKITFVQQKFGLQFYHHYENSPCATKVWAPFSPPLWEFPLCNKSLGSIFTTTMRIPLVQQKFGLQFYSHYENSPCATKVWAPISPPLWEFPLCNKSLGSIFTTTMRISPTPQSVWGQLDWSIVSSLRSDKKKWPKKWVGDGGKKNDKK